MVSSLYGPRNHLFPNTFPDHIQTNYSDVKDLKIAQQKLNQYSDELDTQINQSFVSNISHDLSILPLS